MRSQGVQAIANQKARAVVERLVARRTGTLDRARQCIGIDVHATARYGPKFIHC